MARVGRMGVADVLAMAFMFVLLVVAGGVLHMLISRPLNAAAHRQLELKCEHLYKTLELAWVGPYGLSFLEAAGEQLILREPTVPDPYLRSALENTLEYLRPPGYGVRIELARENSTWQFVHPESAGVGGKELARSGALSVVRAGGGPLLVQARVVLFEAK